MLYNLIWIFLFFCLFSQNSHIQNEARLRVLQAREKHVRSVLEEAQNKLVELTQQPDMYQKVLQKLLEQGLFQLVEREVTVRCREEDVSLLKNLIPIAVEEYEQATKLTCNVKIDTEFLPKEGYAFVCFRFSTFLTFEIQFSI